MGLTLENLVIIQPKRDMASKQLIIVRLLNLKPILQIASILAQIGLGGKCFEHSTFIIRLFQPAKVYESFEYCLLFLFYHYFLGLGDLEGLNRFIQANQIAFIISFIEINQLCCKCSRNHIKFEFILGRPMIRFQKSKYQLQNLLAGFVSKKLFVIIRLLPSFHVIYFTAPFMG